MTTPQLFFAYFAVAMTVLSVLVITRKNPAHSVLWMLVLFIHIAALYLFLNAAFLAAIQMIIYAGAVLVLFLFVIMLLNLQKEETERRYQHQLPLGIGTGIVLVIFILLTVGGISVIAPKGRYTVDFIRSEGSLMSIGNVLYTEFLLPFEIASVVLLVAIIGAVVLAKRRLD